MGGILDKFSTFHRINCLKRAGFFEGVTIGSNSDLSWFIDWIENVSNYWNGTIEKFLDLIDYNIVSYTTPIKLTSIFGTYLGFIDSNGTMYYMDFKNSYYEGYTYSITKIRSTDEIKRTYQLTTFGKIVPKDMVIKVYGENRKTDIYTLKYSYNHQEHKTTIYIPIYAFMVEIEYIQKSVAFDISLAYKVSNFGFSYQYMYDLKSRLSNVLQVFKGSNAFPIRILSYYNYAGISHPISFSDCLSCIEMTETHILYYLYTSINRKDDVKEAHGYSMSIPIKTFLSKTT